MSDYLYKKLKHFTSDESNFILFEPNFGWHRGTHVADWRTDCTTSNYETHDN